MNRVYKVCNRCVMDTAALDIMFDAAGVCNYCTDFLDRSQHILQENSIEKGSRLHSFIAAVKADGKKKPYDCVVGVSGGVDSSWVLVKAVELGLRPLAVHMDNGWNSELAQNNIANLVNALGVDLYTHVVDWGEYRELMQAFFDADVIDIELLYDNAMLGVNYRMAAKHDIRHILFGSNISTEGITIPADWVWLKNDARNIRAIGKSRGVKLNTFPAFGVIDLMWHKTLKRIQNKSILDMLDYNKENVIAELEKRFGYKRYPYKHYESIFTRFYQGFILPKKFKIDKRRVHLSTLVVTNQMEREEAMSILEVEPYLSREDMESDVSYFLKKMGWSMKQLEDYIQRPQVSHSEYASEKLIFDIVFELRSRFRRVN